MRVASQSIGILDPLAVWQVVWKNRWKEFLAQTHHLDAPAAFVEFVVNVE